MFQSKTSDARNNHVGINQRNSIRLADSHSTREAKAVWRAREMTADILHDKHFMQSTACFEAKRRHVASKTTQRIQLKKTSENHGQVNDITSSLNVKALSSRAQSVDRFNLSKRVTQNSNVSTRTSKELLGSAQVTAVSFLPKSSPLNPQATILPLFCSKRLQNLDIVSTCSLAIVSPVALSKTQFQRTCCFKEHQSRTSRQNFRNCSLEMHNHANNRKENDLNILKDNPKTVELRMTRKVISPKNNGSILRRTTSVTPVNSNNIVHKTRLKSNQKSRAIIIPDMLTTRAKTVKNNSKRPCDKLHPVVRQHEQNGHRFSDSLEALDNSIDENYFHVYSTPFTEPCNRLFIDDEKNLNQIQSKSGILFDNNRLQQKLLDLSSFGSHKILKPSLLQTADDLSLLELDHLASRSIAIKQNFSKALVQSADRSDRNKENVLAEQPKRCSLESHQRLAKPLFHCSDHYFLDRQQHPIISSTHTQSNENIFQNYSIISNKCNICNLLSPLPAFQPPLSQKSLLGNNRPSVPDNFHSKSRGRLTSSKTLKHSDCHSIFTDYSALPLERRRLFDKKEKMDVGYCSLSKRCIHPLQHNSQCFISCSAINGQYHQQKQKQQSNGSQTKNLDSSTESLNCFKIRSASCGCVKISNSNTLIQQPKQCSLTYPLVFKSHKKSKDQIQCHPPDSNQITPLQPPLLDSFQNVISVQDSVKSHFNHNRQKTIFINYKPKYNFKRYQDIITKLAFTAPTTIKRSISAKSYFYKKRRNGSNNRDSRVNNVLSSSGFSSLKVLKPYHKKKTNVSVTSAQSDSEINTTRIPVSSKKSNTVYSQLVYKNENHRYTNANLNVVAAHTPSSCSSTLKCAHHNFSSTHSSSSNTKQREYGTPLIATCRPKTAEIHYRYTEKAFKRSKHSTTTTLTTENIDTNQTNDVKEKTIELCDAQNNEAIPQYKDAYKQDVLRCNDDVDSNTMEKTILQDSDVFNHDCDFIPTEKHINNTQNDMTLQSSTNIINENVGHYVSSQLKSGMTEKHVCEDLMTRALDTQNYDAEILSSSPRDSSLHNWNDKYSIETTLPTFNTIKAHNNNHNNTLLFVDKKIYNPIQSNNITQSHAPIYGLDDSSESHFVHGVTHMEEAKEKPCGLVYNNHLTSYYELVHNHDTPTIIANDEISDEEVNSPVFGFVKATHIS